MSNTFTVKKNLILRQLFASYGLQEQLVSDNGSQFTSSNLQSSCNGVKYTRCSPYDPAFNRKAERFFQTFKKVLHAEKKVPEQFSRNSVVSYWSINPHPIVQLECRPQNCS